MGHYNNAFTDTGGHIQPRINSGNFLNIKRTRLSFRRQKWSDPLQFIIIIMMQKVQSPNNSLIASPDAEKPAGLECVALMSELVQTIAQDHRLKPELSAVSDWLNDVPAPICCSTVEIPRPGVL